MMIIQMKGKIKFPITLDASVWIFDDRKVILEDAFTGQKEEVKDDSYKKTAQMFDQEVYFQSKIKPPVNKSINRFEKEKILKHSFVMPIETFIRSAEPEADVEHVRLKTNEDDVIITLDQLLNTYFLFSLNGKPLKEDGPVHLYFKDGSNKDAPIKGIKEIIFE